MKLLLPFIFIFLFLTAGYTQPGDNNPGMSKAMYIPFEKKIVYNIGENNLPVKVLQYGDIKDIVCLNLHDNERTSVQAAKSILEETGGTLIKIENNGQRIIRFRLKGAYYSFDPNRIFSRAGIEQTLHENKKISHEAIEEVEKFSKQLLALITDSTSCLIALHNNTEQAFSIKSYLPGHDRQFDAKAVYADSLQDVDDIILTTDSLLYQKMADNHYNSIWQDNDNAKKDGSLSIFFGEQKRRYINIETQHGKMKQYREMLKKLLKILVEENKLLPGNIEVTL